MYTILSVLFANGAAILWLTFGLTFRKTLFRLWKIGVFSLCSACVTAASVLYIVGGSLLTVLYAAGSAGGALIGEIAVDYVHPMVYLLLISFATALIFLVNYYTYKVSTERSKVFLFRISRVVDRLTEAIGTFNKPRFILLQ